MRAQEESYAFILRVRLAGTSDGMRHAQFSVESKGVRPKKRFATFCFAVEWLGERIHEIVPGRVEGPGSTIGRMPMYKHPGVYIEHVPSGLLSVGGIDVRRGLHRSGQPRTRQRPSSSPARPCSRSRRSRRFERRGGRHSRPRRQSRRFGHAVNAFFANGGNKATSYAWPTPPAAAPTTATAVLPNPEVNTAGSFILTAKSAVPGPMC